MRIDLMSRLHILHVKVGTMRSSQNAGILNTIRTFRICSSVQSTFYMLYGEHMHDTRSVLV